MAKTALAKRIEALNGALETHPKKKALRRELMSLIATGEPGPHAAALRRAARAARCAGAFEKLLAFPSASQKLARTIYALAMLEVPGKTAQKRYGARVSELIAAASVAEAAGVHPGELSRAIAPEKLRWAAEAQAEWIEAVVHITPGAVRDLLFAAAEGYRVPAKQRPRGPGRPPPDYTEVYGLCFGTKTERPKTPAWKGKEVHYTVERCVTQLRASMRSSAVGWNSLSTKVASELAGKIDPQWELLGDFHSHPYRTLKSMRRAEGWEYSAQDELVNVRFLQELKQLKHRPVLGLVVAVARKKKAKAGGNVHQFGDHTAQFTIGNHQYVIGAYVNPVDHRYRRPRELHCASPL